MKPPFFLCLCLALPVASAIAQPADLAPRLSGKSLVEQFLGPPEEAKEMKARTFAYHQHAKGYLDGINDATEGSLWCYTGRMKPHERDLALIVELAKLPPSTLRENAAPLVLDFLRRKYPCPIVPSKNGE